MLVELRLVEQRHKAVLEVLDGVPVVEVAGRYGVSRESVHAWLRRYASQGLGALVDRSSKPESCPHQMVPVVEARIVEMRRAHPGGGARTIVTYLAREGVEPLPGRSSVHRCLVRQGLIDWSGVNGPERTFAGGSGPGRWSCGRWTWWAASIWFMDGAESGDGGR
jgi:transposase